MGIDRISSSISNFSQEQIQLIREFYHLDYWDNHTIIEGFAEASEETTDLVHEKLNGSHRLVQASAGAGLGVAKLLGVIPIGLLDWGMQIAKEVPNGPGKTFYKFLEVPVKGFYHGGILVFETARQWADGSLNNKDSYAIANEVTATLGTAAFLLFGAKKAIDGGNKFLNGMKETAADLVAIPSANEAAVATATVGVATLTGGSDLLAGTMLMSSTQSVGGSNGRINDEVLAAALEKHQGNRVKAADEVSLNYSTIGHRIKLAGDTSPLAKFKTLKGKIGPTPRVSDEVLAAALERHKGGRSKAAHEVGLKPTTVYQRIFESDNVSPLAKFKTLKPKKEPNYRVSDEVLAVALGENSGNRIKTANELGIGQISFRIKRANDISPLAKFKELRGRHGRTSSVSDQILAAALEKFQGDRSTAAMEVGISRNAVDLRVYRADNFSPLAKFKGPKQRSTPHPSLRVSDKVLAAALEKHQGNQVKTADEVSLNHSTISRRIKLAGDTSPLAKFKTLKGREYGSPRVSDDVLVVALERHHGDRSKAASEVGLSESSVDSRIWRSEGTSPLAKFKTLRGKPKQKDLRVKDEDLAAILRKHHGIKLRAARELDLSYKEVCKRIKRAEATSSLAEFKK